ncbi:MAG: transketolase C-terminal domain-containing protein [Oscillospiraceae bacterium]
MRATFVNTLTELARQDPKIALVIGDTGFSVFEQFEAEFKERFINVGIAEQDFLGFSAGLAAMGMRPFAYNVVSFMVLRGAEQIALDLCYQENPVVLVGVGGGFAYGQAGPTHHSLTDIAIMSAMPNMQIICPCDPVEMRLAIIAAAKTDTPMYIRIGRSVDPIVHTHGLEDFEIGKAIALSKGTDIAVFATGTIVKETVAACNILAEMGISVQLYSMHTIKPLDTKVIDECSERFKLICTVEEHSVVGGLGSIVASHIMAQPNHDVRFKSFGVKDSFAPVTGSRDYLLSLNELNPKALADNMLKELRNAR